MDTMPSLGMASPIIAFTIQAGTVLAVVEAKKCTRLVREADEQLRHYITEIAKWQSYASFGFMANGHETWFWELGQANPRLVAGFFTPDDLQRRKTCPAPLGQSDEPTDEQKTEYPPRI